MLNLVTNGCGFCVLRLKFRWHLLDLWTCLYYYYYEVKHRFWRPLGWFFIRDAGSPPVLTKHTVSLSICLWMTYLSEPNFRPHQARGGCVWHRKVVCQIFRKRLVGSQQTVKRNRLTWERKRTGNLNILLLALLYSDEQQI